MAALKTLKDLDTFDMDGRLSEEFKEFVEYSELRAEAIKEIKQLRLNKIGTLKEIKMFEPMWKDLPSDESKYGSSALFVPYKKHVCMEPVITWIPIIE